jgi:cytidyltransferase-like protein
MKKIILVTGGFDPLHSGHIAYLKAAKQLGNILVVGVNSDAWLERKKGRSFMPITERTTILQNLQMVDAVILFNDDDGSAIEAIRNVQQMYPGDQIIFANGGDRTSVNIPEMEVKDVIFVFGVGGDDKRNSSSWILQEWKSPKTKRPWGYYRVLHEVPGTKVKELTVLPGQTLSMQRHSSRAEYWQVSEGRCVVEGEGQRQTSLETHDSYQILTNEWHRLYNPFDQPCRLVEIQYGPNCVEEDIERL